MRKNNTPETAVKNEVLTWLSMRKDCVCWPVDSTGIFDPVKRVYRKKNSKFYRKGVSDILGLMSDGTFVAIECKSDNGRLSPEQRLFLADVIANNGIACVARSYQDVEEAFKLYYLRK